jgi:hypothetical protein
MSYKRNRVQIPFEAYFPANHGAILRDYKPLMEYAQDPITKKNEPTGTQIGMTAVVLSPQLAFETVTIKIVGDMGDNFTYPDIMESFDKGEYIYVSFDDFAGGSYVSNFVTHYTGTASRIYLVEPPSKSKTAAKSTPKQATQSATKPNPAPTPSMGFPDPNQ